MPDIWVRIIWITLYLPIIFLVSTGKIFHGFSLSMCQSIESFASAYSYFIEIMYIFWIILYLHKKYASLGSLKEKKQILFLSIGMLFLLVLFTSGNIVGSLTENWYVAKLGLVGIPTFIGFLGYLVVRYDAFNIKLPGVKVLAGVLILANLSLLFIKNLTFTQRVVVFFTWLLSIGVGYLLIRNAKNETKIRQKINSVFNHHLGTPLTILKGYISLMQDGSYGDFPRQAKEILKATDDAVDDLGKIFYSFSTLSLMSDVSANLNISKLNLYELIKGELECNDLRVFVKSNQGGFLAKQDENCVYWGDEQKMRQAFKNIFEYCTKHDSHAFPTKILINSTEVDCVVQIIFSNTNNTPKYSNDLTEKYINSNSKYEANILMSDMGLFLAKRIIDLHYGLMQIVTENESTVFTICLPKTAQGKV